VHGAQPTGTTWTETSTPSGPEEAGNEKTFCKDGAARHTQSGMARLKRPAGP
jgi:hypothetical protein